MTYAELQQQGQASADRGIQQVKRFYDPKQVGLLEQQLTGKTIEEIWTLLERHQQQLTQLGVIQSVHDIVYGAMRYPWYEEKPDEVEKDSRTERVIVTPLSCVSIIYFNDPDLNLTGDQMHTLLDATSNIAVGIEALFDRYGENFPKEWPETLT